jgi:hypothetical protein
MILSEWIIDLLIDDKFNISFLGYIIQVHRTLTNAQYNCYPQADEGPSIFKMDQTP